MEAQSQRLAEQQLQAEQEKREVVAKGGFIDRLSAKLGQYHEENHVTEFVLTVFSSGRR